ncbi:MAG: N-acetylmuramoyl-L-alanine amidase [Bryobacteraceae bacterium]
MRWTAAFVLFVTVLAAQVERQPGVAVTAVRHWTQGGVVRIAIEVDGAFHFRGDRLHNPERVYFDLADTRMRLGAKPYWSDSLAPGSVVERVRLAQTTSSVTRVVLDLSGAAEISTVQLANPNRLVIEVRPAKGGATTVTRETAPRPGPAAASRYASPLASPPKAARPFVPPPAPPLKVGSAAQTTLPVPPAIRPETALRPLPAALEWLPAPAPLEKAPAETAKIMAPPAASPASAASAAAPLPPSEAAKAARRTGDGDTSLVRTLGLKISRVAIDPGHGGHDQGTHGPTGLQEKDVVLDISLRLGKLIEDKLGAQVIYTRTDDSYVPLEARTALANEKKADLFLSIHGNSSPAPQIVGTETYYLNFSDSRDALDVAARENASSQKSISELHDLIQKISLHDKLEESREFATRIQKALFQLTARNFPSERSRGVKRAPFVVLIGANMPSVLAEIGFLTNSREEALLRRPEYRQKVAEALFQGVSRYADGLSHFQVATRTQ